MKNSASVKTSIVALCIFSILWLSGCTAYHAENTKQSSPSKAASVAAEASQAGAVKETIVAPAGNTSPAAQSSAPMPLLANGQPVTWWFVFKFNAVNFPGCNGAALRNCIFGGDVQMNQHNSNVPYPYTYSQQYVYASSENPKLQKGPGVCLGDTLQDPVGATFNQVYNSNPPLFYVIWNDQFYNQPHINGCSDDSQNNVCFTPWAHSKGMVAWNADGNGFVMQVSTPSWPASGNKSNARQGGDGNTLGCVYDDDVYLSQHFFALQINKDDLVYVLQALQNASVATDPTNKQIVNNGGPADVQALVNNLGKDNSIISNATKVTLSTGVQLISKSSGLNIPPWQMVSALMNGMSLRVASWWGNPNAIPTTTSSTPVTCWAPNLGIPGPVEIALSGQWEVNTFGLDENFNHAKFGVSTTPNQPYSFFGDLNQQGALMGTGPACAVAQNGRGGTFYVVNDPTLQAAIADLIKGTTAPTAIQ